MLEKAIGILSSGAGESTYVPEYSVHRYNITLRCNSQPRLVACKPRNKSDLSPYCFTFLQGAKGFPRPAVRPSSPKWRTCKASRKHSASFRRSGRRAGKVSPLAKGRASYTLEARNRLCTTIDYCFSFIQFFSWQAWPPSSVHHSPRIAFRSRRCCSKSQNQVTKPLLPACWTRESILTLPIGSDIRP